MVKSSLARVCALLNRYRVRYLVIGAQAGILYGLVRSTHDIDIFLLKTAANIQKALTALSYLPLQIAKELDADEVLKKPITIVGDQPRVDLLTALRQVQFHDAWKKKKVVKIDGIQIPHLSLEDLIISKDTDRLQDQADYEKLIRLRESFKNVI
ncbi:MAG: nucleotidyltransferase [Chlamydiae bacterium]|nr:nucleotidyltransferase [Chlamydiota bacterium]MBI3266626.1 nucleotidyltransferase [Chlamydiota bacterium]